MTLRRCVGLCAFALVLLLVAHAFRAGLHEYQVLRGRIGALDAAVRGIEMERALSARTMERYRDSTCLIYTEYHIVPPKGSRTYLQTSMQFTGSGFVVGSGLVVTNRHVLERWDWDANDRAAIAKGARPVRDHLLAFFPGVQEPLSLKAVFVSEVEDIALVQFEPTEETRRIVPLAIASPTHEAAYAAVAVLGYPAGLEAMTLTQSAKNDEVVVATSALETARALSRSRRIRPIVMEGRLLTADSGKIAYRCGTPPGTSGSPILNVRGEVVGISAAYISTAPIVSIGVSGDAVQSALRWHAQFAGEQNSAKK